MDPQSTAVVTPVANKPTHAEDRPGSEFWEALWTVTAAFGVYFCMYAFRKPYTAGTYADTTLWGLGFKTILVTAQVGGYTLSKFIGIPVVSAMPRNKRAISILWLILFAELALVGFALTPRPWNAIFLFLNGLPLGMVFGLVLGLLEGKRLTEALTAGLCASFILADGATKDVGAWLLKGGVSEDWMPCAAGALFVLPLLVGVMMLMRVRPPTSADIAERSKRVEMTRADRWYLLRRFAPGLLPLIVMYLLVTVLRSVRADYAPELWKGLGSPAQPGTFTLSEIWVAVGVLVVNGSMVLIHNNRKAFAGSLATCAAGFLLLAVALLARPAGIVSSFGFMVLLGLGLYFPYVAVHTTVFERMLAVTREKGNIGFLMYIVDSFGYLGYVAVILARNWFQATGDLLTFMTVFCWVSIVVSLLCLAWSARYFLAIRQQ